MSQDEWDEFLNKICLETHGLTRQERNEYFDSMSTEEKLAYLQQGMPSLKTWSYSG